MDFTEKVDSKEFLENNSKKKIKISTFNALEKCAFILNKNKQSPLNDLNCFDKIALSSFHTSFIDHNQCPTPGCKGIRLRKGMFCDICDPNEYSCSFGPWSKNWNT
jgi:hypothetical protein